jgi:hypothetical protein
LWDLIYQNIATKIEQKIKIKYNTINNKIKKLQKDKNDIQTNNSETKHSFFKQTENVTSHLRRRNYNYLTNDWNITYPHKPETWIKTLTVEVDTGIGPLPKKHQAYMRQLVANNIKKLIRKQSRNNKRK